MVKMSFWQYFKTLVDSHFPASHVNAENTDAHPTSGSRLQMHIPHPGRDYKCTPHIQAETADAHPTSGPRLQMYTPHLGWGTGPQPTSRLRLQMHTPHPDQDYGSTPPHSGWDYRFLPPYPGRDYTPHTFRLSLQMHTPTFRPRSHRHIHTHTGWNYTPLQIQAEITDAQSTSAPRLQIHIHTSGLLCQFRIWNSGQQSGAPSAFTHRAISLTLYLTIFRYQLFLWIFTLGAIVHQGKNSESSTCMQHAWKDGLRDAVITH